MKQMTLSDLDDYSKWVGESPEDILYWVKHYGGWKAVFPGDLPHWAHQVRNFFNREPMDLRRFDKDFSRSFMERVQMGLNALNRDRWSRGDKVPKHRGEQQAQRAVERYLDRVRDPMPAPSYRDDVAETLALSGDVYKDELDHVWYQMSPGGTIYHWGKAPRVPTLDAVYAGPQDRIPVFKLISPDGTGGSSETIIENPHQTVREGKFLVERGRFYIGDVNIPENVAHRIVTEPWYQGSYNYSETIEVGFPDHDKRDMKPHEKYPTAYVNPPNRHRLLVLRRFPKLPTGILQPLRRPART